MAVATGLEDGSSKASWNRIRELRKRHGWTQQNLADELSRLGAQTDRAAARWLARLEANGATLAELQLAAGALARLREGPCSELAMETLQRLAN